MNDTTINLGDKLAFAIRKSGMKQKQIAEKHGISVTVLSQILNQGLEPKQKRITDALDEIFEAYIPEAPAK